jgi:hypothetical protein
MAQKSGPATSPPSFGMIVVRYGIGAVMVLAGIVMIVVNPGGFGVEGFAMAVGGGLSVLLINFLFRIGVSRDRERAREEEARRYFDQHGEWPDEKAKSPGRQWNLPRGVVTAEQEEVLCASGAPREPPSTRFANRGGHPANHRLPAARSVRFQQSRDDLALTSLERSSRT